MLNQFYEHQINIFFLINYIIFNHYLKAPYHFIYYYINYNLIDCINYHSNYLNQLALFYYP